MLWQNKAAGGERSTIMTAQDEFRSPRTTFPLVPLVTAYTLTHYTTAVVDKEQKIVSIEGTEAKVWWQTMNLFYWFFLLSLASALSLSLCRHHEHQCDDLLRSGPNFSESTEWSCRESSRVLTSSRLYGCERIVLVRWSTLSHERKFITLSETNFFSNGRMFPRDELFSSSLFEDECWWKKISLQMIWEFHELCFVIFDIKFFLSLIFCVSLQALQGFHPYFWDYPSFQQRRWRIVHTKKAYKCSAERMWETYSE